MRYTLLFLFALLVVGCTETKPSKDLVPIDQVPEPAMKAAQEQFPDVKFYQVLKKGNGEYEIKGKAKDGKEHEVEVTADGKVTEIDDHPAPR
jgi:hypothetical protein